MTGDVTSEPANINLDDEAAIIRAAFTAADESGRDQVEHAIRVGEHLNKVLEREHGNFRRWLKRNRFKKTKAYDSMLLARNAELVRTCGHTSIIAALRSLRTPKPKGTTTKTSDGSPLKPADWKKATAEERTRFLDTIGADDLREAFSPAMCAALKQRITGQETAFKAKPKPSTKGAEYKAAYRHNMTMTVQNQSRH
jgi:hypothetical protein